MRKIGINFKAVSGLSDEAFVESMVELGFSTTFCGAMPEKEQETVSKIFDKHGIACETIHSPFGHINDIWLDTPAGEQMLKELLASVDQCLVANAPIVVIHMSSGNTPPPITDIGRARYEKLVDYAVKKNVKIAFENLRKTANFAWAMETFDNEPLVGFCWDCGHEACYHQHNREFMQWYGDKLICTHIHDNCGLKDADDHWLPFDGAVDFNKFAQHIRNSKYTGSFMLELDGNAEKYAALTPKAYMEKAAAAVKKLVQMTDG